MDNCKTHNALPFWYDEYDLDEGAVAIASGKNEDYRTVAMVIHSEEDVLMKENADFICEACNNYEKMKDFIIQYLASEHNICRPDHFACPFTSEQLRYKAEELLEDL
jgi:AICAR transformylase/IMP cyclohydrolase PurH